MLAFQRTGRQQRRLSADPRAAAGPGAAAIGRAFRVTRYHPHAGQRHRQFVRDDLGDDGLGPLALLRHADAGGDSAARVQPDGAAVLGGDRRAADAVERRAGVAEFHEAGQADAAQHASAARLRLLPPQGVVIHQRQQLLERRTQRQPLEPQAGRRGVRVGVVGQQVAAAQFRRVHPKLVRGQVHQPFRHADGDGVADAAVLAGRRSGLQRHAQPRLVGGQAGTRTPRGSRPGCPPRPRSADRPNRGRCPSGHRPPVRAAVPSDADREARPRRVVPRMYVGQEAL